MRRQGAASNLRNREAVGEREHVGALLRVAAGERESFIDNLLVRIHVIIEMILADRPCAMRVRIPFSR